MGEQVSPGKPFDISKQEVWQAYQKVASNKGAAGVDGVSLAEFEADLKGNLYKIWNRMSSGSYFPPPVRLVEIEKDGGGTRPQSQRWCWSRRWNQSSTRTLMATVPADLRWMRLVWRGNGAGHSTGL